MTDQTANPTREIRLAVFGTGDFALPSFERLIEAGFQVVGLVTQPDRPQGRKQELIPSRIKRSALDRGVQVLQPEDVNAPEGVEAVARLASDLFVTAAYGQILSAELLGLPRLGGINLHGSILPAYRGAAPVARAIQRGESETGVTVLRMTPRIDAGGMIAIARTPIDPDETAGALEARLAEVGAPLIAECVRTIAEGRATPIPQERAKVTKAPKLRKEDGAVDWTLPARAIHDLVRAMQPWPTASSTWRPKEGDHPPARLIIHQTRPMSEHPGGTPGTVLESEPGRLSVAAGSGAVELLIVQPPGKKAMPASDFLRGARVAPGDRFGLRG